MRFKIGDTVHFRVPFENTSLIWSGVVTNITITADGEAKYHLWVNQIVGQQAPLFVDRFDGEVE